MHTWHEKYIRAGSPSTSPDELRRLAEDDVDNVRRRVGENHTTPGEVLVRLAGDCHPDVRIAVGENPMTPSEVLERLLEDEHVDVRYSLAENCHLPLHILEKLTEDDNPYVSHRAMRTIRLANPESVAEFKSRTGESGRESYTMRDIKFR